MKKKFLFLLSIIFVFAFTLLGCDAIHLQGGPAVTDTVYGNGGSAVIKGDYLYFANAFVDYSGLGINDNKYDKNSKQKLYGIFRTKLDSDGKVELDANGNPKGAEMLSFCVGGYAYSGLYIMGDYLYYSTPYSQALRSGGKEAGRVRFERIKLDGTKREELYSADYFTSECTYDIVQVDGVVYIVVFDKPNSKIIVKRCSGNNPVYTVASNVKSMAVVSPTTVKNGQTVEDINKYIYYTTQDGNNNYQLKKIAFARDSASEVVYQGTDSEILVKAVKNNRVYFLEDGKMSSWNSNNTRKYYSQTVKFSTTTDTDTTDTIINYAILDDTNGGLDRGIVGVYYFGSTYSMAIYNGEVTDLGVSGNNKITVVASQINDIYYQVANDTKLYKLDFTTSETETVASNFDITATGKKMLDLDSKHIFVYEKLDDEGTVYYLKMYMTAPLNAYLDDEENLVGQYIGVKNI